MKEIGRVGSGVRVTVRLLSARDGKAWWADRFDTDFATLFALEDKIAGQVAGQLSRKLSDADRRAIVKTYTSNPAAHEQYLKGRYFWSQDTEAALRRSLAYFEKAVDLDPGYSLARASVAEAYIELVIQAYESRRRPFPGPNRPRSSRNRTIPRWRRRMLH